MIETFEKRKHDGGATLRAPVRFERFPQALANWSIHQRADFEVWYATLPWGHRFCCENTAIIELARQLRDGAQS